MAPIRHFSEVACIQALNAHETEFVSYYDALRTAQRLYYANWKAYRIKQGHWGNVDEKRAQRYTLPCAAARKLFDTDVDIQRLLASRDKRLSIYRNTLDSILKCHIKKGTPHPSFKPVIHDFIQFCYTQTPRIRVWYASFGEVNYIFPERDTWAICCFMQTPQIRLEFA